MPVLGEHREYLEDHAVGEHDRARRARTSCKRWGSSGAGRLVDDVVLDEGRGVRQLVGQRDRECGLGVAADRLARQDRQDRPQPLPAGRMASLAAADIHPSRAVRSRSRLSTSCLYRIMSGLLTEPSALLARPSSVLAQMNILPMYINGPQICTRRPPPRRR